MHRCITFCEGVLASIDDNVNASLRGNNFDSTLYARKLNTPNRSSYVLIIRRKETDEKSSN